MLDLAVQKSPEQSSKSLLKFSKMKSAVDDGSIKRYKVCRISANYGGRIMRWLNQYFFFVQFSFIYAVFQTNGIFGTKNGL